MRQLASVSEIIDASRGEGTRTPDQQLEALISMFCSAARSIDPSITKTWVGRGGDLIADGPEYENSWASCKNVIRYQCRTEDDVRRKVTAILENGWLEETAEIGFDDEPFHFRDFLKTLIVTAV